MYGKLFWKCHLNVLHFSEDTWKDTYTNTYTLLHTQTHAYIHTNTHTHINIQTHAHTHTHSHTTHIHTHTHTLHTYRHYIHILTNQVHTHQTHTKTYTNQHMHLNTHRPIIHFVYIGIFVEWFWTYYKQINRMKPTRKHLFISSKHIHSFGEEICKTRFTKKIFCFTNNRVQYSHWMILAIINFAYIYKRS